MLGSEKPGRDGPGAPASPRGKVAPKHRTHRQIDQDLGACGIGFVADVSGRRSRDLVDRTLGGLANVKHRGALAADERTSDGAGVLLPFDLTVAKAFAADANIPLDTPQPVAIAMVFLDGDQTPQGDQNRARAREILEKACVAQKLEPLGWRRVPTEREELGEAALQSLPSIEQLFVAPEASHGESSDPELQAFLARKRAEAACAQAGLRFYVASFSFRIVVYKALCPGDALGAFYPDLMHADWTVPFGIFHMRFSTNTAPSWERAQPFRFLCHNGEINAIAGNEYRMQARNLGGDLILQGEGDSALQPVLNPGDSDSGKLDTAMELLVRGGRDLRQTVAMTIPEAWENVPDISPAVRDFYRFHACLMEPWDGPAAIIATDGIRVCASLDRNGLRPLRWAVSDGGLVAACSEAGAIDLSGHGKVRRGRLGPGQMICVDPTEADSDEGQRGRPPGFQTNEMIKAKLAAAAPYGRWVEEGLIPMSAGDMIDVYRPNLSERQARFGWTKEEIAMVVKPMVADAKEPTFAMGDDTPIPAFSKHFRPIHHYLKQRFAQVTNPPIDHLRERLVMSLRTCLGPRDALLQERREAAHLIELPSFFVYPSQIHTLTDPDLAPFLPLILDATFELQDGAAGLERACQRLADEAEVAVAAGVALLTITDMFSDEERVPIPAVLGLGAIQHRLVAKGMRSQVSLIIASDEVKDTHHLAVLLGYGADLICPRLAIETVASMADDGVFGDQMTAALAQERYQAACEDGVLKIMSKMGISALDSYRGAQIFEAVGLSEEVIDLCLRGTISQIGGTTWQLLGESLISRHEWANSTDSLSSPGLIRFRKGGEYHANNPTVVEALQTSIGMVVDQSESTLSPIEAETDTAGAGSVESISDDVTSNVGLASAGALSGLADTGLGNTPGEIDDTFTGVPVLSTSDMRAAHTLQNAVKQDDYALYKEFADLVNQRPPTEPHDLLDFAISDRPVPIDEVEPIDAICRRFTTGAMSHGAISREAHETLAIAMNMIGGKSNCGEGGESADRYYSRDQDVDRNSRIKQIASGRFGVTPEYCMYADELQIKMAQGSKPGEGGQIPGHKVTDEIARLRQTQPGVTLISPPPHHDIYSIEDLAQLIFDLRQVNPHADVSVKLVAVAGVGTVAAGVAKGLAGGIHISGSSGGTGASPLSSIKHAGLPWSLGLAETQDVLMQNGLRERVRLSVDGGFKTGRDAMIAALLGADEFSFGTAALMAEGCIMVRACHRDTCPVGIATQRPHLRAKFAGTPEMVVNYMRSIAQEMREWLAAIGLHTVEEAIGRRDLLSQRVTGDEQIDCVDLSILLAELPAGGRHFVKPVPIQQTRSALGDQLYFDAFRALWEGDMLELCYEITNSDRSVGAMLGGAVALEFGSNVPPGHVTVHYQGSAGQSFGAFMTRGLDFRLTGEANDYVGKAMAGGMIVVKPPEDDAGDPHLIGNTVLYGATGGELFCAGGAGERFGVRNSGAVAVVEGVGQHCAEYMTGGTIVILGDVGNNLGAGMTGGQIFVYDPLGKLGGKVNASLVRAMRPESVDLKYAHDLIERHQVLTDSPRAQHLIDNWRDESIRIWRIAPLTDVARIASTQKESIGAAI